MTERKLGARAQNEDADDAGRRTFLKVALSASAVLAAGGVAAIAKSITNPALAGSVTSSTGSATFPRVKIVNITALEVNQPMTFYYPLDDEPNYLIKLGLKANNGVGPDGDIVAYSSYCQHLGCVYGFEPKGSSPSCKPSYVADRPIGYCCCHGSIYDLAQGAEVIGGPAPRPVPMVTLEVDSAGDIYATGMTAPAIFGHNAGADYVSSDLQGGNLVSG